MYFNFLLYFNYFYDAEIEIKMDVFNHPTPDQLDIHEKAVENIVMGGASTKDSCFFPLHNIEITPPQLDNTQRLSNMIDGIP